MNNEILEIGNKTEEGRLKIKKIKKLNLQKGITKTLKGTTIFVSILTFLSSVYIFFGDFKDRINLGNDFTLDYVLGLITLTLSFIASLEVKEINENIDIIKEKIELIEEDILNSNKEKAKQYE